jgi:hypothetical protein
MSAEDAKNLMCAAIFTLAWIFVAVGAGTLWGVGGALISTGLSLLAYWFLLARK